MHWRFDQWLLLVSSMVFVVCSGFALTTHAALLSVMLDLLFASVQRT